MKTLPDASIAALVGPTASGKSALAQAAAEALDFELIAVDSVQAVRGFDIGSAKPTLSEQRRVRHHLIDVATWDAPLDASQWAEKAKEVIGDAQRRGRRVLLVGGSGLYLRALMRGLIDVPRNDALREELLMREAQEPHSLWKELLRLDRATAEVLKPNNIAHVIRALEVTLVAKEPASELRARHKASATGQAVRLIALDRPDDALRGRIASRSRLMLQNGLVDEVKGLLAAGASIDSQPMRAIGYRQVAEALRTNESPNLEAVARAIDKASWQYVRRQRTWLRREAKDGGVCWLDGAAHAEPGLLEAFCRHLAGPAPV